MISLEAPKKFRPLVAQAHQVAENVLRPIARKYDREEHARPKELDMLAALIDGMTEGAEGAPLPSDGGGQCCEGDPGKESA